MKQFLVTRMLAKVRFEVLGKHHSLLSYFIVLYS